MGYMKEVKAKGNMVRAIGCDDAADILFYLPTEEVVNTVLVVRAWYGKVREMKNNMERHEQMSEVRIHTCINELQETNAAPGSYKDVVVTNKTYKVRTALRVID